MITPPELQAADDYAMDALREGESLSVREKEYIRKDGTPESRV